MGRRGAVPARAEFLHAPARPRGAKARDLSGLAPARRAWRIERRHSFCSAGRVCDARLEPALRARPRNPADRRRAVRHQGRGAGDRDRGAVPHRQTRAQVADPSRSGRSGVRRHFLFDAAVSADRGCSGARRLRRCAQVARAAGAFRRSRKRAAGGGQSLAALRHRIRGRPRCLGHADRARGRHLRSAPCPRQHRRVFLKACGRELRRRLRVACLHGAASGGNVRLDDRAGNGRRPRTGRNHAGTLDSGHAVRRFPRSLP